MRVVQEEIFGPVPSVQRFNDTSGLDSIAALANATQYGLGAMLWTANLSHAHLLAAKFKAARSVSMVAGLIQHYRLAVSSTPPGAGVGP
jgi:acyl-CoA reductase-like NAD-dependent aldehyde dehydrogenase